MPDSTQCPDWMAREIVTRWDTMMREHLERPPPPTMAEDLAKLGLDGSRLRPRYWHKVKQT